MEFNLDTGEECSREQSPREEQQGQEISIQAIQSFAESLGQKNITFSPIPNGSTVPVEKSDELAKWFIKVNNTFEASARGPNPKTMQIDSFVFDLTTPWNVKFSSASEYRRFSFGHAIANKTPAPGICPDTAMLYCGLVPTNSVPIKTIKELYHELGLAGMTRYVLGPILDLTATLDQSDGARNALWFNPRKHKQTTIRLQFRLKDVDGFNTLLAPFHIHFPDIYIICKRVSAEVPTLDGSIAASRQELIFWTSFSAGTSFTTDCTLEFIETGLTLVIFFRNPEAILIEVLKWLRGLTKDKLDMVEELLAKDDKFSAIQPRRVTIMFHFSNKGKIKISSVHIELQVSAHFGQVDGESKPVTFLVSYKWTNQGGMGYLRGEFWNDWSDSSLLCLQPTYEKWTHLQPTAEPAKSINILKLVNGAEVKSIPHYIPTDITRLYFFLSQEGIAMGGTITCEKLRSQGLTPQPYLGEVKLDLSYDWGKEGQFRMALGIMAGLQSSRREPSTLTGLLEYSSRDNTWELNATVEGLYASCLVEFFDPSTREHIMPLIESIELRKLALNYSYRTKKEDEKKVVQHNFSLTGSLYLATLALKLTFKHDPWIFEATLEPRNYNSSLGEVIAGILGGSELDLPDFISSIQLHREDKLTITVKRLDQAKALPEPNEGEENEVADGVEEMPESLTTSSSDERKSFIFAAKFKMSNFEVTFIRYHGGHWRVKRPSKSLLKIAFSVPELGTVPLIGPIDRPVDQISYTWIHDPGESGAQGQLRGLTRIDVRELSNVVGNSGLDYKDTIKGTNESEVVLAAGSHFSVSGNDLRGRKVCLLDYAFNTANKSFPSSRPAQGRAEEQVTSQSNTLLKEGGGTMAQAPFKKRSGPLSLKNIGLKYADKTLQILLDGTFELGPITFSLLGLRVNLRIATLKETPSPTVDFEGMTIAYMKYPLTLAGSFRSQKVDGLSRYAGGLVVGLAPYQFQAAGFYGDVRGPNDTTFVSLFVFARLDGPLITFQFAEISGLTGGIGYNSHIRTPATEEISKFPFIAPSDNATTLEETLSDLVSTGPGAWMQPKNENYWAAAGLQVTACQILSLYTVVVVQFGESIKLNIFAVGVADIPSAVSPHKFAHVELGLGVVVDLDFGILKVQGALSKSSYILHPDCALTGGFGLLYCFDGPRANKTQVGNFIFTLGGYHEAFHPGEDYPNPERLAIDWSLGSMLKFTGKAYFAITPKTCMGGGDLHASYEAGPITAWFDAHAHFLINYQPFNFRGTMKVSVGARCNLDAGIIDASMSLEVSAELTLWGPPMAGRLKVNVWFHCIDINFGDSPNEVKPLTLNQFYDLVKQSGTNQSETAAKDHLFLPQSGLSNASDKPSAVSNAKWMVRAGTFSFTVACRVPVQMAAIEGQREACRHAPDIYAKPMQQKDPLSSTLAVTITRDQGTSTEGAWGIEKQVQPLPKGLWDTYDSKKDPLNGTSDITDLLTADNATVNLMTGVHLKPPPPTISPDPFPRFLLAEHDRCNLDAKQKWPQNIKCHTQWEPAQQQDEQWSIVQTTWKTPHLKTTGNDRKEFVSKWADLFSWDESLVELSALPERMTDRFLDLFVAAPRLSEG